MITDEEFNKLKTESVLSKNFAVSNCRNFVVFNNYIIDINTFKLMLLWKVYDSRVYVKNISQRTQVISDLKNMNKHDRILFRTTDYQVITYLNDKFTLFIKENTDIDLINCYENSMSK